MASPTSIYRRLPMLRQRTRRLAVVGAFTGYPALILGYALLLEPGRLSMTIWGPIAIALFSMTLGGLVAIYGFGQGRMGDRRTLDERQRTMTDKALIVSYGILATVLVLGLGIIALVATLQGPVTLDMETLTPILLSSGLYLPALPFAALAWIEPDVPMDDEA